VTYLRPIDAPVTCPWSQPRPLSVPPERRDHVHGACDYAAPVGTLFRAVCAGVVYRWCLLRPESGGSWQWPLRDSTVTFPWGDYAYDVYGGVTILRGNDNRVHLYAHSYLRQVRAASFAVKWFDQESPGKARWPLVLWHTFGSPTWANAGDVIGQVGDAGYSEAPHLHYEVHNGWEWTPYGERPDPAVVCR